MYVFYITILLVYYIIISAIGVRYVNKMKNITITERERIKNYKETIIEGWIPVLAVLIICIFSNISLKDIGLNIISFQYNIWFTVITLVISGMFLLLVLYQIISYLASSKYREQAKTKFINDTAKNHYIALMSNLVIPRSKREKYFFFWLSLTAGIGEELVFRGFFYYILHTIFPDISSIMILVIVSVSFGLFHIYHGFSGVIKTLIGGPYLDVYI
jgi:membrane protease YdiL (CAAX protease family)